MTLPSPPNGGPYFVPASELAQEPITWLWPWRLALGKPSMLEGDPGLGKSLITIDLAARLSTGRPWPDGSPGPGVGKAIILNAEDAAADTVVPRLRAAGADLANVLVRNLGARAAQEFLRLPNETRILDEALAETPARLLVLDPLVAFLDRSVNTGNDQSVRSALDPLSALAARHGCHFHYSRHLNKSGAGQPLYRGGGSIGFTAACRSSWLVAPDPKEPDRCVLAQVKNNIAGPQPSLAYRVKAGDGGVPVIEWLGPSPWTAWQLLARTPGEPEQVTALDEAAAFLQTLLQDGPLTSRQVWAKARPHGFTERTLHRAKKALEVETHRTWLNGRPASYWLLRGQKLPEELRADPIPEGLREWLEPLCEKYPPPSPLDDM